MAREVKEITDTLYKEYGSDSGYLLGIEPKYRESVEVIVKFVLSTVIVEGAKCENL